jgi:hypothetical protein
MHCDIRIWAWGHRGEHTKLIFHHSRPFFKVSSQICSVFRTYLLLQFVPHEESTVNHKLDSSSSRLQLLWTEFDYFA